ncbi:MAG: hypothetical protein INR71_00590 [Terriglobus roseus]|nr:hypothetical protein [Terriglobus roseus]
MKMYRYISEPGKSEEHSMGCSGPMMQWQYESSLRELAVSGSTTRYLTLHVVPPNDT